MPASLYEVGRDLRKGAAVRLCGLSSGMGKLMNEKPAIIVGLEEHGRFAVLLQKNDWVGSDEKPIKIKIENMRLCCNGCFKDSGDLLKCSGCGAASYCTKECQVNHWKIGGHRQVCAGRRNESPSKRKKRTKRSDSRRTASGQKTWIILPGTSFYQ